MSEENQNPRALALPIPVKISVGGSYDIVSQGSVIKVTILKITEDAHGNIGIMFRKPKQNGSWGLQGYEVVGTTAVDFKTRILQGGLEEVEL